MERVLRQTVVIGPQGRVEIPLTELIPGTTAEILVLPIAEEEVPAEPQVDRKALVEKLRSMSEKAIAEGMERWGLDQVNAEIHERRYGDRERYS